mmetsp:Transcript_9237/g.26887  ORF Transcript_9237/g.26887 Transcript_9237/m.26887 type:complete len:273 (+) Transcript_9237:328-1146(+)
MTGTAHRPSGGHRGMSRHKESPAASACLLRLELRRKEVHLWLPPELLARPKVVDGVRRMLGVVVPSHVHLGRRLLAVPGPDDVWDGVLGVGARGDAGDLAQARLARGAHGAVHEALHLIGVGDGHQGVLLEDLWRLRSRRLRRRSCGLHLPGNLLTVHDAVEVHDLRGICHRRPNAHHQEIRVRILRPQRHEADCLLHHELGPRVGPVAAGEGRVHGERKLGRRMRGGNGADDCHGAGDDDALASGLEGCGHDVVRAADVDVHRLVNRARTK